MFFSDFPLLCLFPSYLHVDSTHTRCGPYLGWNNVSVWVSHCLHWKLKVTHPHYSPLSSLLLKVCKGVFPSKAWKYLILVKSIHNRLVGVALVGSMPSALWVLKFSYIQYLAQIRFIRLFWAANFY